MNSRTETPREIFLFLACLSDNLLQDIAVELNDQLAALSEAGRAMFGLGLMHKLSLPIAVLEGRGYTVETRCIQNDAGETASLLLFDKET